MPHPSGRTRSRTDRWFAVALLTAALAACAGDSPTGHRTLPAIPIAVQPSLIESPSNATARPINRIRASARRVPDDALVGDTVLDVNPSAASWEVGLSVDGGTPLTVSVTVLLIHVDGTGAEEVQFSGRAGPITLNGTPVAPDVAIARGPLANFATTSVSISSAPAQLPLGSQTTLGAEVGYSGAVAPTVFWTSLDPGIVSMADSVATAVAEGTATIVASAGIYADTVTLDVVDPDSVPPALVAVEPAPDATGVGRATTVRATFDEPIDPASATPSTFVLRDSLGAAVPASVGTPGAFVTLTPDAPLESEHRYTATLDANIRDPAGNALGDPFSWSFTTGGLAVPAGSFDPGLGLLVAIAFDDATGRLVLHDDFSDTIRVFDTDGIEVGPSLSRPGPSSNDIDLDFTLGATSLGATPLPSNTLLVHNGEANPSTLFAVDKSDGTVLDSMVIATGGNVVGAAFHPGRGTHFAVSWNTDQISEIELETGAIVNTFPVQPTGSPTYDVFYGDLDVDPDTGNLYLVSSASNFLRVLSPDGVWIEDYDILAAGVSGASGIAWDAANGIAWISTTAGLVHAIAGIGPG